MKLIIVDDEPTEIEGMQAILQKAFPEIAIYSAKNGMIAIELAIEIKPDIMLMDIMMPGMTGLEAVEIIQEEDPTIKFVMVTAFDMFDYARQAIKLGVKDYLLKPSKASEIVATVGKVLEKCKVDREAEIINQLHHEKLKKTLTLAETDIVTQLLFDHVHEVQIDMLVEMLDFRSSYEMFVIVVLLPEEAEQFYVDIKEKVRETSNAWVGALYGQQLPIIVSRDPDKSFRLQAITLTTAILSIGKKQGGLDWFIGIGQVYEQLDEIRQSYQEALIATMDKTYKVKSRFYTDVSSLSVEADNQDTKQQQKEFLDQIRLGDWVSIRTSILNMILQHESDGSSLVYTQQRVLKMLWIANRVMDEIGIETDVTFFSFQAQDYRQLRTETLLLLERMKEIYELRFNLIEADKIYQIKQYIYEHSHKDISLDMLAQKVNLSPIYISKMFKEKLGINYIDFLTECRIEKAKKLLSDPELSLKEIAIVVGYHEPNYFSKVFKKVCGVSPSEYRKTLYTMQTEVKGVGE